MFINVDKINLLFYFYFYNVRVKWIFFLKLHKFIFGFIK